MENWILRELEKCRYLLGKKDLKENERNSITKYKKSLEDEELEDEKRRERNE